MLHQCTAFVIVLLLAGYCPVLVRADKCYQTTNTIDSVAGFTALTTATATACAAAGTNGCYEWHTTAAGRIHYRAGCNAAECPAATGYNATMHTCVKCREATGDGAPASVDKVCSAVTIVKSIATARTKCPFIWVSPGRAASATAVEVYCLTDKKCGTQRWQVTESGKLLTTNYTGCLSDCNSEFQAAGGSATVPCVECDNTADCATKLKKEPITIAAPTAPTTTTSGGGGGGGAGSSNKAAPSPTPKGANGQHSMAAAAFTIFRLGLAVSCFFVSSNAL